MDNSENNNNNNNNYIYTAYSKFFTNGGIQDTSDLVRKFDTRGNLVKTWHIGGLQGDLKSPLIAGIAVDKTGKYVYTIDSSNNRIEKFSSDGSSMISWHGLQEADDPTPILADIAIDSHGDVYVVDSTNQRLEKFDSSGNLLLMLPNFVASNTANIALDSSDNLYQIDDFGTIIKYRS